MRNTYKISKEEAAKIRKRMKSVKNKYASRRLEALAHLGEGKTAKEVAGIKGYHEKYVCIWCGRTIKWRILPSCATLL